jgi:hypothetical protein
MISDLVFTTNLRFQAALFKWPSTHSRHNKTSKTKPVNLIEALDTICDGSMPKKLD